jgi:hypothetical protein
MDGSDSTFTIMAAGLLVLVILAGWSTVRYELDTSSRWRVAKYVTNVLALVFGLGLGQLLAIRLAAAYGIGSDNMIVVLTGFIAGSFVVMWAVQSVEYALRRRHGLEPLPYRLVRFDLFRW